MITTKILVLATNKHVPNIPCSIIETLKKSLRIAAECEKQCIVVTYDLVKVKVAYQIQSEKKTNLTAFHLQMALFHAYGALMAESIGPHILNKCLLQRIYQIISNRHKLQTL